MEHTSDAKITWGMSQEQDTFIRPAVSGSQGKSRFRKATGADLPEGVPCMPFPFACLRVYADRSAHRFALRLPSNDSSRERS